MSQEEVYREFQDFDWASLPDFQEGLSEILAGHLLSLQEQDPLVTSIPAADQQQLIDQAKLFFFCSHTGHILNLDDFYAWKRNNGAKITLLPEEAPEAAAKVSVPETAPATAPAAAPTQSTTGTAALETPYSSNYQQLVELIVSGQPIPGIKQIPDTVLLDKKSESQAKARPKPWEVAEQRTDVDIQDLTS